MDPINSKQRRLGAVRAVSALFAVTLLGACASTTQPTPSCCYQGEAAAVSLNELYIELADGKQLEFAEVFPGFTPDTGLIGLNYPIKSAEIARVGYDSLGRVLPGYDANDNSVIEGPELAVLYVTEAAAGLGYDVAALGINPPVSALHLSQSDQSGFLRYVRGNLGRFGPDQRKVFHELELLGIELRSQGGSHEDRDRGSVFPNG